MDDISTFLGGLPPIAVVLTGYAAIVVALGVVCEALGTEEEKVSKNPAVRKQLRTIGAATKAFGGMAAAISAAFALAGAKELEGFYPLGPVLAWIVVCIVVVGFGLILRASRRSHVQASATTSALDCGVCGHTVAAIHTLAPTPPTAP